MPQKATFDKKRRLHSWRRHASKSLYRTFARHSRKILAARKLLKNRIDVSTLKKVDCCIHDESCVNSEGGTSLLPLEVQLPPNTCTTPHADMVKYSGSV